MKKIILIWVLLLSLISCGEIEYDGETKLVVKGKILDKNNQPINNKLVKLIVSNFSNGFLSNPSEINFIGRTLSKEDGSYVMIIPEPSNFDEITVEINPNDDLLNLKKFINIRSSNFLGYEIELSDAVLFLKTDLCLLNVTTLKVTQNYQLLDIKYIGEIPIEIEDLNPIEDNQFYDYQFYDKTLNVAKNQIINLEYKVRNTTDGQVLTLNQNVIIGAESEINFTLNY